MENGYVVDKITYLVNHGFIIIKRQKKQPHSTLYHFDCGCVVHGEINLEALNEHNPFKARNEAHYRHWITACEDHKYLENSNVSFQKAYEMIMT